MKTNNLIPYSIQTKTLSVISQAASSEFEQLREVASELNMLDVENVPSEFLPFLAWQFRVEVWDAQWSIDVKRNVVKAALAVHRTKGTVHAVELALAAIGVKAEIVEWWQAEPQQEPGTFDIVAYSNVNITPNEETLLNEKLLIQLENLIRSAKRHSQHFTVTVGVEAQQSISTSLAGYVDNMTSQSGALIPRQPIVNGGVDIAACGISDHQCNKSGVLMPRQPFLNGGCVVGLTATALQTINISGRLIRRGNINTNI
ncbi:phage tail protein I [Pseudoalteromonas luteoviolacea]|uniref:phage tail protein I n=1 Tax=Pseudoalteromonas luteoviolacea TaxID=43657 RepID=UPI00114ED859|nr:phage tail protein I [Pseudoalteromonas luteoviolacea]TQF71803.1 phage tail protein I [Pseudoalteromonas luteoviolacea]